jgi:hypothetical protein
MGSSDMTWSVWRGDGRGGLRAVLESCDEQRAAALCLTLINRMRQGIVQLRHGEVVIRQESAPRLRTRW